MVYNGRDTHAEITTFRLSRRKAASSVGCDKMIYINIKLCIEGFVLVRCSLGMRWVR